MRSVLQMRDPPDFRGLGRIRRDYPGAIIVDGFRDRTVVLENCPQSSGTHLWTVRVYNSLGEHLQSRSYYSKHDPDMALEWGADPAHMIRWHYRMWC